jgi:hypothetical protein
MRFLLNGKLEDQGGVGFAVQDGVVFSTSSRLTSSDGEDRKVRYRGECQRPCHAGAGVKKKTQG